MPNPPPRRKREYARRPSKLPPPLPGGEGAIHAIHETRRNEIMVRTKSCPPDLGEMRSYRPSRPTCPQTPMYKISSVQDFVRTMFSFGFASHRARASATNPWSSHFHLRARSFWGIIGSSSQLEMRLCSEMGVQAIRKGQQDPWKIAWANIVCFQRRDERVQTERI